MYRKRLPAITWSSIPKLVEKTTLLGKFIANKKGYGFVEFNKEQDDLYIPKESVLNATRIINALSSLEPADKYIIAMSGDIAFSGKHDEYNKVYEFIHDIFSNKSLSRTEQYIECLCVPGNHDVDFFGCNLAKNADEFKE